MFKILVFVTALGAPAIGFAASAGGLDFSACQSAVDTKDPHQRISLFTICLKHGGVGIEAASVIFANRGFTYEQVGEVEKAFQDFNSSIQYYADWPYPYFGRSGVESGRGLCTQAVADIDKAMKMGPPQAPFLNRKAWILATCADPAVRDWPKAVALAQQALKIREDPAVRDTLAAAYAEAGQFDQARAEQAKAIAGVHEQPERVDAMQARLELYNHQLPFHTGGPSTGPATSR